MSEKQFWGTIEKIATIQSVGDLVQKLQEKQLKIDFGSNEQLFYRGEPKDYASKLVPKVFRDEWKDKEYEYYYDILTNFPQEFEGLSNLSRLAKMQHYWCPTRLLDLTSNPLVALYFACCDDSTLNEDGFFYIFKTKKVLNYDSDRALLLSSLAHLNAKQQNSLLCFINDFLKDKNASERFSGRITNEYIKSHERSRTDEDGCFQFGRLIAEVMRERSAFIFYNTVATDLLKRYIVRPLIQNERQKKQEGLFLIFGLQGETNNNIDNDIEVYCFKVEKKLQILKELDLLGINKSSIYCDMENRANYLKANRLKVK